MANAPTLDIRLRLHEKADQMELVKVNGWHTTPLRDRVGS
jgi:hypothetical protein